MSTLISRVTKLEKLAASRNSNVLPPEARARLAAVFAKYKSDSPPMPDIPGETPRERMARAFEYYGGSSIMRNRQAPESTG
jgi:hypothetical protein